MTSSEAFVESLAAEGVTKVPGIVGSAFMDALDMFPAAGIDFVSVAHEQNAVHMADGYARVSNEPSLVVSQNGPGITNFVTGVAAAYWAHTPMVVVTPSAGSMGTGLGGFQETEQLPIFSKITKWQVQVNRPERMAELMRRAFYVAKAESGPVQVDIPRDYFYGESEYEIYPSATVRRGSGTPEQVRHAATLLAEARNPVIVSGGGVVQADGVAEVAALAEYLSAPVTNSYLHNDSFPHSHELSVGPLGYQGSKAAMRLISEADVVFAVGCRLGPFGTLPQHGIDYWPSGARIIQVDTDHRVLGLSKKIHMGIAGDAKETAAAVLDALRERHGERPRNTERIARIAEEKASWAEELASWSARHGEPLSPRRSLALIRDALPDDTIVSTDIGNICSVSNSYLHFDNPRRFLAAMSFGNCGYAYPTALGAKLAAPDNPVMAYVGDGAWGMSMAEVLTAARHDIPVVAVVWNNSQWGAEKKNQIDFYDDRFVGTNLTNPDFAEVAKTMGADGITVDRESDLQGAVRDAFALRKPVVLNVNVDSSELGEPFRRDALRNPIRHLGKYEHLNG
ncbi:sulfoacetaldehyde acetyltransferase [Haloechinothrix sp. YIM 98757]|uniref:Sulfoacetaldehyde acetyltransferase n=2 Tax=Haloechinothrix aidingensis TaxID=2752311 RepID=A0A838AF40_9PSEU|nr:sulfoacetaldehyde acetyltransferase [Haloechinothrix aidingensis]